MKFQTLFSRKIKIILIYLFIHFIRQQTLKLFLYFLASKLNFLLNLGTL